MIITFGRYAGTSVDKLPLGYVQWLLTRDIDDDLRDALTTTLSRRPRETPEQARMRRKFEGR